MMQQLSGMLRRSGLRNSRALASALTLLLVVGFGTLHAQLGTASLSGTVVDPSGASVPSVGLTLESTVQKYVREAVTSGEGGYLIAAIPPGRYKLTVTKSGFSTETFAEFALSSGHATTINVVLRLATPGVTVTVVDAPPLLNKFLVKFACFEASLPFGRFTFPKAVVDLRDAIDAEEGRRVGGRPVVD